MADEDAFDDGADGVLFVGVEVLDGFEAELPVVGGGAFVGVEDELIGAGVERECESSDDVEGGLCWALFVSADLGDVDVDAFAPCCVRSCGTRARRPTRCVGMRRCRSVEAADWRARK